MKTLLALGPVIAFVMGSQLPAAVGGEPRVETPEPTVKLGKVPDVRLTTRPAVGEARVNRIKELIADLARLDSPDIGLSATLSGDQFAPVPGQTHVSVMQITGHRLEQSRVLRELVALGPDALPHLLNALDDQTPTGITIKHGGFDGGMSHGGDLDHNPVNRVEAAVYKSGKRAKPPRELGQQGGGDLPLTSYTVKVGDVCFVAIGQITGRHYSAVKYQPTAFIMINSPTHDAGLRADVRAVWKSDDAPKRLLDSLLIDYATEGIYDGESVHGWYEGSNRQCGAALRLLYYFPRESTTLIADRLSRLDVGKGDSMQRWVASGVRTDSFIKAVAWCEEPRVRAALTRVFNRAENPFDLLAAMPGITDRGLIRSRLEELIGKLPAEEEYPWTEGYQLLIALAEQAPGTAKAVCQRYLRGSNPQRCWTVCGVLEKVKLPWDIELLGPLLEDQRESDGTYLVEEARPGQFTLIPDGPRLPLRVCDAAARTLSRNHPELKFTLRGQHADLDKQIAVMRELLKGKK